MRKLLEFRRSPNCVKVRLGLHLKELEFEAEEMTAGDRAPLLEAANWPLVPVLIDGEVVMRDSLAILHYLDANYRSGISLSLTDPIACKGAEHVDGEMQAAMTAMVPLVRPLMSTPAEERDPEKVAAVRQGCDSLVRPLEAALARGPYLFSDHPTVQDLTCVGRVMALRPPAEFLAESQVWQSFSQLFHLSEEFVRVRAWCDGLLARDGLTPA
ncbi:MAG: glutathione S-transferase family protein [Acidobacteriota bacterium]